MKATLTPELASSVDRVAKSDRPGVPRRKNSTLWKILQYLELICRGNAEAYNTITKMFDVIGTATTPTEASLVLDQME